MKNNKLVIDEKTSEAILELSIKEHKSAIKDLKKVLKQKEEAKKVNIPPLPVTSADKKKIAELKRQALDMRTKGRSFKEKISVEFVVEYGFNWEEDEACSSCGLDIISIKSSNKAFQEMLLSQKDAIVDNAAYDMNENKNSPLTDKYWSNKDKVKKEIAQNCSAFDALNKKYPTNGLHRQVYT